MNKIFRTITAILIISFFVSCSDKKAEVVEKKQETVETVKTQVLTSDTIVRILEFPTTLQAYQQMKVSPSLTGTIEHIYVDVSSRVSEGQLLVRMDQNQLNTAKINFSSVQVELDRVEKLKTSGSASQQSYDKLKAQYDQLKQNISFLERNTFVKAPFAGVVAAKNYEDGEMYAGQMPILHLMQINNLKALINIPESYFPAVKSGMKVNVRSDIYSDKVFAATITTIYPTVDPASHNFQVEIKLPNSSLLMRPGMFVYATLELGKEKTLTVPSQAILKVQGSNERYVFINDGGVAKNVKVTLGQRFDDKIEIISDEIKEGDEIVIVGQARLSNGVKLNVIK